MTPPVQVRPDPGRVGLVLMVGAAMTVSAIAVVVRTGAFYFFSDDFLNFVIVQDMGLSWKYLQGRVRAVRACVPACRHAVPAHVRNAVLAVPGVARYVQLVGDMATANAVVLALVLWSAKRRPASLVLWGGFVLYFVVSIGVIGWNRAVPCGIEAAGTGRYYADILCLFLAFMLIALGRPAGRVRVSHWQNLVVLAASAFGSVHMLAAGAAVPHVWFAGPERPAAFVTNVRAALSANGETMTVADGAVPGYIMPDWMAPLNRYRLFLRLLGWHGNWPCAVFRPGR